MVNHSTLGFTNRRTKEQARAAFGTDASVTAIPGREKTLSIEEYRRKILARLDGIGPEPVSKDVLDQLNKILKAAVFSKHQHQSIKKRSAKKNK